MCSVFLRSSLTGPHYPSVREQRGRLPQPAWTPSRGPRTSWRGPRPDRALVFLEHGTRRPHIAGPTAPPTGQWTGRQACDLAVEPGLRLESLRFLVRDRNAQDTGSFDAVFAADGIKAGWTAPRAPRMNAHGERDIKTLRREVLDHLPIRHETHARQVLAACARPCSRHRPHQARGRLPPPAQEHSAPVTGLIAHRL
ncbi:transposase [Streptomyces sp. M2CJ-2]|uniref:transposase n=1 Tax=Streptomyces sp. M2CJ-2 TaxID=2803948 RepID=UPI001F2F34AB|nr:transposase [Streptomyces sp. M2CJ-2]